jgi:hypothetical protein
VVFAILPVSARFADDPLLRLRQLDPELSPPTASAVCGSPVRNLNPTPTGPTLYELARADACQEATRRRLGAALATGGVIVMVGLLGATAPRLGPGAYELPGRRPEGRLLSR